MAGKFIVFEGLDGSGITTQATLLRNYFLSKNKDAMVIKEPTDGLIGGIIRASLRKEWQTDPTTLQMLFAADRAHHLKTDIEPNLKKGKIVICDRYVLSSLAYGTLDVPLKMLTQLNGEFRAPNMTFIVDTQPAICLDRIKRARPHMEIFEEEKKLQQVRQNFLSLKKHYEETYVVDGNRPADEIMSEIVRIITKNSLRTPMI